MTTRVKICGLSTSETVAAAVAAGADQIGFVFHPSSPRCVRIEQAAALAAPVRGRVTIVALVDDAADDALAAIVAGLAPDLLQLHGRESPARVDEVRAVTGVPVMKALGVATAADVAAADPYRDVADHILFDAKPPPGAAFSGGHGKAFDWAILDGVAQRFDYTLSGGLTAATVRSAIDRLRPAGVDVSSGVERAKGIKDVGLIAAFLAAAKPAAATAAACDGSTLHTVGGRG
jgi:phosphoribosylanthranilate isomerase